MKRYSMTQVFMGLGCAMVATHDGNYVLHSEAQTEIDALKAQRDALLAAQQWQPIESAPKNQTVLLFGGNVLISTGLFDSYLGYWKWRWAEDPTHWQPLPPPPAIAKTGENS